MLLRGHVELWFKLVCSKHFVILHVNSITQHSFPFIADSTLL